MADDRIYLRCKDCGKVLFLGKRLGGGYYWTNYGLMNLTLHGDAGGQDTRPLEDRLNEFYDEHFLCTEDGPINCFEIVYESDPSFHIPIEPDAVFTPTAKDK